MTTKVSIVIPIYNNAESILLITNEAIKALESMTDGVDYELIMINDGSHDNSWELMQQIHLLYPERIVLINLVRNFGQLPALLAGYNHASGDAVISMAADMQDPPTLIPNLIQAWRQGHKLVVAQRSRREDGFVSDLISNLAWRILKRFALPNLPKGGFDFFLMDASIRDRCVTNPEQHVFIQGRLLYFVRQAYAVPYERAPRYSGRSQTSLGKRIKYLIDGFTGYSYLPLRLIAIAGISIFLMAMVGIAWIVLLVLAYGAKVEGWASTLVVMMFLNGAQLLALGIIGEYLWRGLEEQRKRPHFVVDEVVSGSTGKIEHENR